MSQFHISYLGHLKTEAIHLQSGTKLLTAAPTDNQGDGSSFSPTDLVCVSLASCMITTMGIVAKRHGIDLKGLKAEVTKVMSSEGQRRIQKIHVVLDFEQLHLDEDQQIRMRHTALTCPVALSLDPAIMQVVEFRFGTEQIDLS